MSHNEISATAREYRELQAEIKALQEQADAVKARIIASMDEMQAEIFNAGAFTIRYAPYQTTRVDTAKLKDSGLYDQFSTTSTAIRFSIA